MGEKIRDIKPITIGKTSLMVELNEGYYAAQGRLIHVQNSKFRYLFTEKDFYYLCSLVMRAWSEFDYIKHNPYDFAFTEKTTIDIKMNDKLWSSLDVIVACMNRRAVHYCIVDANGSGIRLIVKPEDLSNAEKAFLELKWRKVNHPYGKENGYRFLYQMNPFLLYELGDVYCEIYCQLPCMSITPKTWIPLDRTIQKWLWEKLTIKENIPWCDSLSRYIFYLCWAIFVEKGFPLHITQWMADNVDVLDYENTEELFATVFFKYTPYIIQQLKRNEYENIVVNYYAFNNY